MYTKYMASFQQLTSKGLGTSDYLSLNFEYM